MRVNIPGRDRWAGQAVDAWLRTELSADFDGILTEPLPDELLMLLAAVS